MKISNHRFLLAYFFILAVTFVSFYPSLSNGWTSWDDNVYVIDNPFITAISFHNIKAVFTKVLEGSYVPLTMVSYMIDYQIGEYNPMVYHLTNLVLHLCNSCLAFWLAYQLSGNFTAALVAGVLFGIHPMRVESVAWISGRKDVLSMFFFLLSSIWYLSFLDHEKRSSLTLSFLCFVCAILSKIIVLTFPILLFLFDYHRNRKFSASMVVEKLPFVMVATAFAFIGYFGQAGIRAIKKVPNVLDNMIVSLHGVVFYLEKFLLPVNLSNLYPYPASLSAEYYLYAALFFILLFLLTKVQQNATVIFGSLFFFISLLPVLQFVRFSQIFAADRFTYFAYIGLFYIVGVYGSVAAAKWKKKFVFTVFAVILMTLSYATWQRCGVWKDSDTLWKDMLSKYPDAMERI